MEREKQMPKYRCHKTVRALKIVAVQDPTKAECETDGSRVLIFAEEGFPPRRVDCDYVRKHRPQPGGYYVQYEDGYQSFSPAEPFEAGYTKI